MRLIGGLCVSCRIIRQIDYRIRILNYMETTEKHQYLKFFGNKTAPSSSHSRWPAQFRRYEQSKLLPHIAEEYNFRITNHLLIKKIICPKRDKTIMHSLEAVFKKNHSSTHAGFSSTASRGKWRSSQQNRKKLQDRGKRGRSESKLDGLEVQDSNLIDDNSEPIIIQRSFNRSLKGTAKMNQSHPSQSGCFSIIQNKMQDDSGINSKATHSPPLQIRSYHRQKSKQNGQLLRDTYFLNPPGGFGNGPTIIMITHIAIIVNPALKGQTLMQLQLIERPAFNRYYKNIVDEKKEKAVATIPIRYQDLPRDGVNAVGLKFAVKVTKIGDFVPLRIWKYSGVDCMELGTIDLPLSLYKEKRCSGESTGRQTIFWQKKQGSEDMGRNVLSGEVQCRLRKAKLVETEAKAHIRYKIYSKKYSKVNQKVEEHQSTP